MGFKKEDLQKVEHPLYDFGNKRIEALGKIDVNVTFGHNATMRTEVINFDVIDFVYPYNAIFGRNTINKFAAVIHQGYLLMKIPTAAGIIQCMAARKRIDELSGTLRCTTGKCTLLVRSKAMKSCQRLSRRPKCR
jgi:hypothetical protein